MNIECPECGAWVDNIEIYSFICPYCKNQIIDYDYYIEPNYNNNRNNSNNNKNNDDDNTSKVIACCCLGFIIYFIIGVLL